VFEGVSK